MSPCPPARAPATPDAPGSHSYLSHRRVRGAAGQQREYNRAEKGFRHGRQASRNLAGGELKRQGAQG